VRSDSPRPIAVEASAEPGPVDAEYAFQRVELESLGTAVGTRLGGRPRRLASPEELRRALAAVLGAAIGDGSVEVRRMPQALHTTEYWHVTLTGVTVAARTDMDRLVEEARCVR
jgi:hypothetical protein